MSEHHDEPRAEALGGELDAADLRRRDDVPGHADDEQVAQALVEDDLRRHPRVGASEDDGDGSWPVASSLRRSALVSVSLARTPDTKRRLPSRRRSSASRAEIIDVLKGALAGARFGFFLAKEKATS